MMPIQPGTRRQSSSPCCCTVLRYSAMLHAAAGAEHAWCMECNASEEAGQVLACWWRCAVWGARAGGRRAWAGRLAQLGLPRFPPALAKILGAILQCTANPCNQCPPCCMCSPLTRHACAAWHAAPDWPSQLLTPSSISKSSPAPLRHIYCRYGLAGAPGEWPD